MSEARDIGGKGYRRKVALFALACAVYAAVLLAAYAALMVWLGNGVPVFSISILSMLWQ